ncbi:hypothetical protein [Nocardia abscessus]|uniref:hypothetical protein n=1 Tax=Nocardia abscessus TaxID=120957 RepID=UPI002454D73A|nr:hypothetical protein [Nocardia abscessus]
MLYESSARAEGVLMLDVGDLDIANRCTVSVASNDVDPTTGRARLSHGYAAELFEAHTEHNDNGPVHPALHQLRHPD